ncbi:MAG: 1-phosphofructokinase family hexose kinase [Clostridia bacterium]|nr:1-phosphofructokinase family hexose kinase [Clostridia bacterium]
MIYTLTTNPAIDMNIRSNELQANTVTRTRDAVYTPNGKGLNVSFTLQHFGVESTVLGFFGGFSGEYIVNGCREKSVPVLPIWVEDATRINVFLNDGRGEYNLVNAGSFVPREAQDELLNVLCTLDSPETLCISGSLPRGIDTAYYEEILQVCNERAIPVVLDISSPKLKELLSYRPLLIKPNDDELRDVFGMTASNEQEVLAAMAELHRLGAQNVFLTLGSRGSYFSNGSDCWQCGIHPVKVYSTACAGDATLGGFLSLWLADKNAVVPALQRGAACGANAAESAALGDFAKVAEYSKNIAVRKV